MQLSIIIIVDGWTELNRSAKSCHQPKTRYVAGRAESLNYDSSFWIALLLNVYQSCCCCCWSDDQSRLPPAAIDPPSHQHQHSTWSAAAASTLDLHPSEPVAWVTSNCAQLAVANGFCVIISNNNNITNNKVTDLVLMHFSSYSEWWL